MAKEKVEQKKSEEIQNRYAGALQEKPAWLKNREGKAERGSERVTTQDLIIPRLEIVQDLSPARKKEDPGYIDGADSGMIYNNVTREVYDQPVLFCPVMFRVDYLIWRDRQKGGGFRGAYDTQKDAFAALEKLEDGDECTVVDTQQQFGLVVLPDRTDQIVISMAKTKAKVSRRFNSLVRMHSGEDRFARVYKIVSVPEKNSKGQYYNYSVSDLGFADERVYKAAEALYEDVKNGRAQVSTAFDRDATPGSEEEY